MMYVHLTRFELLPDKTSESIGERILARVLSLPGLKAYTTLQDGVKGVSIITYGKKTDAEAAVAMIRELWRELEDLLVVPPVTEDYEVSTPCDGGRDPVAQRAGAPALAASQKRG